MIPTLLLFLGAALLVGGAAARHVLTPGRPARRWLGVGAAAILLGAGMDVWSTLHDLGFTSGSDVLTYLTTVTAGRATLTLLLGACLLLAVELGELAWLAALGAASILVWGLAGIGHGASHGPWVRGLHALHLAAMNVWVAGVAALLTVRPPPASLARTFTPYALGSVVTLAVTGSLMTWQHAGPPLIRTLPSSLYGQTLLLKLALVALTVLAAVLVRRAFARGRGARLALSRELVLLLAVLGVTAALTQTPTPSHGNAPAHAMP